MVLVPRCVRCNRPTWSALSRTGINVAECESTGNPACQLAEQRNSVIAALRGLLLNPVDLHVVRTARAVLDHVTPVEVQGALALGSDPTIELPGASAPGCPCCGRTITISMGAIGVHYRELVDIRPCPGSYLSMERARQLVAGK